jgi:rod shape-determining protein MreB
MFKKIYWLKKLKESFFKEDLIIDIGSNKIMVTGLESDYEINEASLIAIEYHDNYKSIIAIGNDAKELQGKEGGNIKIIKPIKEGKIEDKLMVEHLLRQIINKYKTESVFKLPYKILMITPTNISDVDREQREDVIASIGSRDFQTINNLLASAVGMGGDIGNEKGVMVLDIGEENIQCGIVKLNKIITSQSFDFGIGQVDGEIIKVIREKYKIAIGSKTAEKLKIKSGLDSEEFVATVCGKDVLKNTPIEVDVNLDDVRECIQLFFKKVMISIQSVFEDMPEEIAQDIKDRGIMVCGGGSQLKGLEKELMARLNLKIQVAESDFVAVHGAKRLWVNMSNETIINYDE